MLVVLVLVGALAATLAVWATVRAVRDEAVRGDQLPAIITVEVALVVQAVVVGVLQAGGHDVPDGVLLWGYLVTSLVLLPVAFGWAFVERTRWSSVVLAIAAAVVVVLQVRIWQLWQ
ncbi:hypothetical protein C8046_03350 [Serinibacter arcticus]|uniref:Integral membrane protein n=1 Tax=Serinibacter arcticus TaxID=1655435 RepID=A0A2U1ZSG4_9MICO|nr:hypothetical protein [Serinibacter arcticus]PWD49862.1 hypothetical protein C8046_03350 [Serinibacter arcticus]